MADVAQVRACLSGSIVFYAASEEAVNLFLSLITVVVWILSVPFHLKAQIKAWFPR